VRVGVCTAEHQSFIEELYNEGVVKRPTDKAAGGRVSEKARQEVRGRVHGTLEKEGYPPEASQEFGKREYKSDLTRLDFVAHFSQK